MAFIADIDRMVTLRRKGGSVRIRATWATTLLAIALSLSACGGEVATDGPPEINFGRDICIECGMVIDDPRFAASYRLDDGTEKAFDDLGGLIIEGRESGELDVAKVWVSDFDQEVFIDAESAHYVPTLGVASPMGHGILAFADMDRATKVAEDLGGEVIDWHTAKELPVTDGLVGHHHMDMDGGMETGDEDHSEHDE
jgi:copper chaperone NosL